MKDKEYRAEQIAAVAREMASLDLVNVVRCRDCEQMRDWTAAEESASYGEAELADGWCMFFRIGTYEDFFCAWGERK